MFAGHLGVGLLAKSFEPKISLGTWVLAALLADLILFTLLIAGIEGFGRQPGDGLNRMVGQHIVYSHSLLMDVTWAGLFAAVYYRRRRYPRGAWLLLAAVVSHWLLDFVSHRPDMPLAPGVHQTFGLGLWNSIPATLAVEGGFWLLAIIVYVRATHPVGRAGVYAFWIGVALFTLSWYKNMTVGMEPNPVRAGIGGLIFFLLIVAWAYWVNRLRSNPSVPL